MSNFKDDDYVKEFICRTQMNYFMIQNLIGHDKETEISHLKEIMANKRILKRKINYVCSELFSEVVAASYSIKADDENVKALLTSILVIHNDYIRRVSHVEPGMSASEFFKDLITKFNKQVSEIIDQISNIE